MFDDCFKQAVLLEIPALNADLVYSYIKIFEYLQYNIITG